MLDCLDRAVTDSAIMDCQTTHLDFGEQDHLIQSTGAAMKSL
jgi:hypothetical protein